MWECPDLFSLGRQRILSFSPQGLEAETYRFQNRYQSGWCVLNGDFRETDGYVLEDFHEWDMGFDFYAPQTFEDDRGRRILIGWMGMIECDYDNLPTVRRGWQHCLTIPRELIWDKERKTILQRPVCEMERLRAGEERYRDRADLEWNRSEGLEVIASIRDAAADLNLEAGGLCLNYEKESGLSCCPLRMNPAGAES